MKSILNLLYNHAFLTQQQACQAMLNIVSDGCPPAQAAAFLAAFIIRKPTVTELAGFRQAVMQLCSPLHLSLANRAIDIVGTGGDEKNSFNISTLSAIVVAATGTPVIKHGNYGFSSVSGSSSVLEYLGYTFSSCHTILESQLSQYNLCFVHAPLFHPVIKNIAPIRKSLGVRSLFNLIGPLTNPARPRFKLLGVNSLQAGRTYRYLLQHANEEFCIVHSLDGYDEISLTGPFKTWGRDSEAILSADTFGIPPVRPDSLYGGATVAAAADIFMQVLEASAPLPCLHVVAANAALAMCTANPCSTLIQNFTAGMSVLQNGTALKLFSSLCANSNGNFN